MSPYRQPHPSGPQKPPPMRPGLVENIAVTIHWYILAAYIVFLVALYYLYIQWQPPT
jgi:hypothetical protein